ncbi:MAG: aldo/keto reductase [Acidobacteriota bacterium]
MTKKNEDAITHCLDRRDVLKLGAAAAAGIVVGRIDATAGESTSMQAENRAPAGSMPTRNLGKTGFRVGIFSLGGQAAIEQPDNEKIAVPLLQRAIELGINYIDTSARYGGEARWSEKYIGQVMKERRSQVFLATKSHDRTRDGSLKLLETSLKLLQTDHVDLWQIHAISVMEDVDQAFGAGGALKAFLEARDQKLVRFLGVTGHTDPEVLMEAIRRFAFDTILMTLNPADPHHLSFKKDLLPLAVERQMGIIGMKIPSRGRLLSSWTPPPVEQQRGSIKATSPGTLTMREVMRYALTLPVSTVIIGCDSIAQLEENVAIARDFTPLTASQLADIEKRAVPVARQALFYRRWDA